MLEQLQEHRVQLQNRKVEVGVWVQTHDSRRVLELPGRSPPLLQGGNAAAKEICPDSTYGEPRKPEAKNPSDGDLQPLVFRATLLQSLPRTIGAWRTAVKG